MKSERLTGYSTHVKYVHTKMLIVDPFDDENCCVVTGSGNFSKASVEKNDDNYMIIRKNRRVCDVYLTEFMRVFDHFRIRDRATKTVYNRDKRVFDTVVDASVFSKRDGGVDSTWTSPYLEGGALCRERKLFGGGMKKKDDSPIPLKPPKNTKSVFYRRGNASQNNMDIDEHAKLISQYEWMR